MVEISQESNNSMEMVFRRAWVQQLIDGEVFQGDPDAWKVTPTNLHNVTRVLNISASPFIYKIKASLRDNGSEISYTHFCKVFQEEFIKAAAKEIRHQDDSDLLRTPAQKIISLLREIQNQYISSDKNSSQVIERINYAIDKIGQRTIFDIDYPLLDSLDLAINRRPSLSKGWLNEYSHLGLEMLREASLRASIQQQKKRGTPENTQSDSVSRLSRAPSLTTVLDFIDNHTEDLKRAEQIDFNTIRFCEEIGRKQGLSVLTVYFMRQLGLEKLPQLDQMKVSRFIGQIYKGYRRDVEYHNDIHATDVLQMCFIFLTKGGLHQWAQLNELDTISVIMGAISHDFGHDGMTNAYHVNSISDRAIRYSDQSVQENYHAAESFAILNQTQYNFLENFSRDDFKTFRQRFIGIILATDMARHSKDLANIKNLMEQKMVKNGVNCEELIDKSSTKAEFDSKQQLLEFIVHAADVSTQTRTFEIAVEWTQLLFEEFFNQGDVEKEKNLPVSFLCDRETTQIPQSQPGFVNFILIPLFSMVSNIIPTCAILEQNAKNNEQKWKTYEETPQFKQVYRKKTPDERKAVVLREKKRSDSLDEDEDCTVEPPKINEIN